MAVSFMQPGTPLAMRTLVQDGTGIQTKNLALHKNNLK